MEEKETKKKSYIFELFKALLFAVALMVLFVIIQIFAQGISMIASTIYAVLRAFMGDEYFYSKPILEFATGQDALLLATLISTIATGLIFFLIWMNHCKNYGQFKVRAVAGFKFVCKHPIILILSALFCYGFATWVVMAENLIIPDMVEKYSQMAEEITGGNIVTNLLAIVILGPIGEECLFRGLIQERFSRVMPAFVAIILQALVFGAFHGNLVQGVFVIGLGILNGYLVYRTNSIVPAIFVHSLQNGISLGMSYIPENITENMIFMASIFIIPILSTIILFNMIPRDEYGKIVM